MQVKFSELSNSKVEHEFTKKLLHCAYAAFMNEIVVKIDYFLCNDVIGNTKHKAKWLNADEWN